MPRKICCTTLKSSYRLAGPEVETRRRKGRVVEKFTSPEREKRQETAFPNSAPIHTEPPGPSGRALGQKPQAEAFRTSPCLGDAVGKAYLAGISVLPAPDGTFIHPIAADRTKTSIVAQSLSFKGLHLSPRRRATDWNPCFSGISQTPLHTCAPCHRRAGFVALQAARQPAGTGSAQILRSMSPNSRRVRCPSASRSQ